MGIAGCGCNIEYVAEMDYLREHFPNCEMDCLRGHFPNLGNSRVPQDGYVYFKRKSIGEKEVLWSNMFGKY